MGKESETFNGYAKYYNLFYNDKPYAEEADFIDKLIQKHKPGASTVLDLGCGSGQHDFLLGRKGYFVTGIDRSPSMLALAQNQKKELSKTESAKLRFIFGDVRRCRIKSKFDAVISMFHVASYQTRNEDIKQFFQTASYHLKSNGVFIFDCWYGPGVLRDLPKIQKKEFKNDHVTVKKMANPKINFHQNTVDVDYCLVIKHKESNEVEKIKETHCMRYLFRPEILMLMECAQLDQIGFMDIMTECEIVNTTPWSACFVCRKLK